MTPPFDEIQSLREALSHSPGNVPLRRHIAELLMARGAYAEAAGEYREILKLAPGDTAALLGLARAYFREGKSDLALVVLEENVLKSANPPAEAHVIRARALAAVGRAPEAARAYQQGIAADPDVADPELATQLGVFAAGSREAKTSSVVEGRRRASEEGDYEEAKSAEIEKPSMTFEDVGGMDKPKEEIRIKIILPITNREIYAAYGKKAGGGVLLYGPPGCGKTHLARATAGEIKSGFMAIGLHDVLDMWIGNSEKQLHAIFEQARNNTPAVLFFDEVDALAASRTDMRQSAGRHLINQFLNELDGATDANEGVLVLAATNAPWHLDPAFRRPGRFDRIIFVPPPDAPAREAILKLMLKGKPAEAMDLKKVANKTDGFSGADLRALVDHAVENALREAMKSGRIAPLTEKALLHAAKEIKPSTREWFAAARNYALFSNESGLYDDILEYLNIRK